MCFRVNGICEGPNGHQAVREVSLYQEAQTLGNHFWQRGYFVDSVGANEEIIQRYVRYQDKVAKEEEEKQIQLGLEG